jgi:hypothetical protein
MLASRFPAVAQMPVDAKTDLTGFSDFPQAHWRKSTNPKMNVSGQATAPGGAGKGFGVQR